MVRSRPSWLCSVWHIASTWALGVTDCFRRSRSSSKNPPAERRLKNATPNSHASTSQGRASGKVESYENPADALGAGYKVGVIPACGAEENRAGASALDGERKTKVPKGVASIRSSATTPTM